MEALQKLEQVQKIIELLHSHAIIDSTNNNNVHSHRFLANFILFLTASMEALQKLEQVQKVIELLHSHAIIDSSNINNNNVYSHRFLANFILFLTQPSGELDFSAKCQLISGCMPKISAPFLEDALQRIDGEGHKQKIPIRCKEVLDPVQVDPEQLAMIELDAMQRANSTLEDFCRSYFMFHKMDPNQPQSIFRYLPILSFTESYIYQLDSLNEKLVQLPAVSLPVSNRCIDTEDNSSWVLKSARMLTNDPFRPLIVLLENHGILTERITEELNYGEEYWALERKLCSALTSNKEISFDDVTRAIHLKSFDYRVLNLILYQLRGEKVNELHMEFLSISEFLVEVSDDLFDYEEDVLENNFNILRMFVRIYGASAAPAILAKFISEAEEKYDRLLKALDPELSMNYQRRCEEATKEGGKTSGPSLGTWCIPPVIEDEDFYRAEILNSEPTFVPQGRK